MARSRSVTERQGVYVDTTAFKDLAKRLRNADALAAKNLRRELRASGELVADAARARIDPFSTTIGPTIKVRVAGAQVEVRAGGGDVAIASLFELGNTGGRKSASAARGGKFRHPVFGNRDVWVEQDMHPYLLPAAVAMRPLVNRAVMRSLTRALDAAGLETATV